MKRVKLIVAYDGTNYCGWQVQPNGITIEQVLNENLSKLLGENITVTGASPLIPGYIPWGMWRFLIRTQECRRIKFLLR